MVGVDSRPFGEFVGDLTALLAQLEVRMRWEGKDEGQFGGFERRRGLWV